MLSFSFFKYKFFSCIIDFNYFLIFTSCWLMFFFEYIIPKFIEFLTVAIIELLQILHDLCVFVTNACLKHWLYIVSNHQITRIIGVRGIWKHFLCGSVISSSLAVCWIDV